MQGVRTVQRRPGCDPGLSAADRPRGCAGRSHPPAEGSAFSRRLLHSILYFTHTSGKVSTEALPLDAILFDEVQEMSLSDIERARERIAASPLRMTVAVSTANFFGADIHALYMESDQREFFTRCQCPNGFVMAEAWDPRSGPLCIGHGNGSTPGVPLGYFYRCPRCDFVVNDPQNGEFCARQPGSRRIGFHFPQMLSPRQSAADIVEKWDRRVNTKNFYNRILRVPYSDPDTQPVTEELLRAAQNSDIVWPVHGTVPRREDYDGIYAGIDQHGGNNYIVIAGRPRGSSRMRLLHLEVIESNDPFSRLHELMRQFRVRYAAIESLPNYNEAFGFAKAFPDRVFVVTYLDLDDDLVLWGDRVKETLSDRRTDDEAKLRCSAKVDQFKMMSWALSRWVKGEVETPDARILHQTMRTREGIRSVQICQDVFWRHLRNVALVTELRAGREDERRMRSSVKKVGGDDPHFAYAWMLMCVSWVRAFGANQMLFPEGPPVGERSLPRPNGSSRGDIEQIKNAMPALFDDPRNPASYFGQRPGWEDDENPQLTCYDCCAP